MSGGAGLRAEVRGPVLVLTIDRPERRNAVDMVACEALRAALEAPPEGARVVVLTGAGGHFCAGADLGEVTSDAFRSALRAALDAVVATPLPVVAAVEGAALGAGTQLAVAADLRVATPDARFGIPAARLGLMVDHWTVRRLVAAAGDGAARQMLLAAGEVDGERALALGLVQRLGSPADAVAWAGEIARLAPLTVAGHKRSLDAAARTGPGMADEPPEVSDAWVRAWSSDDLAEGLAAFREKRPPRFGGR